VTAAKPAPGVCRFCGIAEDQVDGDKRRWLGESRTVCDAPACIRAHYAEIDRRKYVDRQKSRKRSPGEIHELIKKERREKRKAARSRQKGRAA
jgi:hypothetical protein